MNQVQGVSGRIVGGPSDSIRIDQTVLGRVRFWVRTQNGFHFDPFSNVGRLSNAIR